MAKIHSNRTGCKDIFHAFLVENANYDGEWEIPRLIRENKKPEKLLAFSKAKRSKNYNAWIHFFEDDVIFERIWNSPKRYLSILSRFKGVITPDFSVYRDMPLVMQYWNIYRSRAIGYWLQRNGIFVIPNIRFGDERTYAVSCSGIEKHGTVAIGSYGCIKGTNDSLYFKEGLQYIVSNLEPNTMVVYGSIPDKIFKICNEKGVEIIQFDSDFSKSRIGVIH